MKAFRFGVAIAAVAVLGLAGSAVAGVKSPTEVKLTNEVDVAGKLKSPDMDCLGDRKVTIIEKLKGGGTKKHGSDNSDSNGKFSFGNPGLDKGKYFVKAKGTKACEPGKSDTFRISGGG